MFHNRVSEEILFLRFVISRLIFLLPLFVEMMMHEQKFEPKIGTHYSFACKLNRIIEFSV